MGIKSFSNSAFSQTKDIIGRFRRRDFSGNTGTAMKNSTYSLSQRITAKVGSLLFTIILARLLLPELYGLYGLALSTILLLGLLGDLGISTTLMTYLSKHIDKDKKKAKAYFTYLTKYKLLLLSLGALLTFILADFLANTYYQKPIYYAVLAGIVYYPLSFLFRHVGIVFRSQNNFKIDFFGEVLFQVLRLTIVPLATIFLLSNIEDTNIILLFIILSLSLCFFFVNIYYITLVLVKKPFNGAKSARLSSTEKKELWYFTLPLTFTIFSGVFLGNIDSIMLGHYVDASYIGFYRAALNLVGSASAIISFAGGPLLPIFSRMKGKNLQRAFRKARLITIAISLSALTFTIIIAPYVVLFVYGAEYAQSTLFLRLFSLLIISAPLTGLYQTYYTSQEKTKEFSLFLFITTLLNIVLNFFFINFGLQYGMLEGAIGACLATVISRYTYLAALAVYKKKIEKTFNK